MHGLEPDGIVSEKQLFGPPELPDVIHMLAWSMRGMTKYLRSRLRWVLRRQTLPC